MKSIYFFVSLFLFLAMTFSSHEAQSKWYKYNGNPVLARGESGEWDDAGVSSQFVLWDGEKYNMWYGCENDDARAVGYATSSDGINWVKYENNPVLERGIPGEWDSEGVMPSSVLFDGSQYMMYYIGGLTSAYFDAFTGADLDRRIGLAISSDGINWIKDTENNPVLSPGEEGSWDDYDICSPHVVYENSTYKMWYSGASEYVFPNVSDFIAKIWKLGYAESDDGVNWTKRTSPVLEEGSNESWPDDLVYPCVINDNSNYSLWYFSDPTLYAWLPQINCASSPNGTDWNKFEDNPVLSRGIIDTWDENGIQNPSVLKQDGNYKMWYDGSDGENYCIGYAEDFSGLVHADTVILDELFFVPNQEPVNILCNVLNPEGHALSAKAMIMTDDGLLDSIELSDDGLNDDGIAGDGIYGGYIPLTEEMNYTVGIKTVDQVTEFTRSGLDWGITGRFTSRGPVLFESIEYTTDDPEPNAGSRARFNITLHNFGITDTVNNIDINIIIPDSLEEGGLIVNSTTGTPKWGDIPPGETLTNSSRPYAITFSSDCEDGLYSLKLEIWSNGEPFWYDNFDIPVGVDNEGSNIPDKFVLAQNYPNPFNPTTTIEYSIPQEVKSLPGELKQSETKTGQKSKVKKLRQTIVTLKIYDILGREVTTLVNEHQRPGYYEVKWDASGQASGVYFYKLTAGTFSETKKMILLR